MNKNIKIAEDINISIDITNFIGNKIYMELNTKFNVISKNDDSDISLNFNNYDKNSMKCMAGKNYYFSEDSFVYNLLGFLEYKCDLHKEETIDLSFKDKKTNLKNKIRNFFIGKKGTEVNTIMSYSLFWLFFQFALLKKSKTFLHAGIFANKNNEAIAITGSGGCGKTSTMFKILEEEKYLYLSEDFGIIDKQGYSYFNPKALSIYESDINYNPVILGNLYKKLSFMDQLKWQFQKNILHLNPMKKINPESILEERIIQKAKLKKVLFFLRTNISNLDLKEISKEELSERCLNVNLREFQMIYEYSHQYKANKNWESKLFDIDIYKEKVRDIYLSSFSSTENYLIYIPFKAKPDAIVSFLNQKGLMV